MKPPMFDYYRPSDLNELTEILSSLGEDVKILAGGQSLIPMMNLRLIRPTALVDINRIPGLNYIEEEDGVVKIGALVRQQELLESSLVREKLPLVAEAAGYIAHIQIRNRGTVLGNLSHADPASELPAVMLALGAEFIAFSKSGRRVIPAEGFYLAPFSTALSPGELLMEVRIKTQQPKSGSAFVELARRSGDYAIVGVAAYLSLKENRSISQVRVAICGAGPKQQLLRGVEEKLVGRKASREAVAEAAARAAEEAEIVPDWQYSESYKRGLVRALTEKALLTSLKRAGVM